MAGGDDLVAVSKLPRDDEQRHAGAERRRSGGAAQAMRGYGRLLVRVEQAYALLRPVDDPHHRRGRERSSALTGPYEAVSVGARVDDRFLEPVGEPAASSGEMAATCVRPPFGRCSTREPPGPCQMLRERPALNEKSIAIATGTIDQRM